MTLTLDPATEQLLQQELATGDYREPSALIAHALILVKAERDRSTHRAEMIADIEESIAQARRGEGITGEALRADHIARKAAYEKSLVVQT
jgi:hypothetical protein